MRTRGKGIARREALKGGIDVATMTSYAIAAEPVVAQAIHADTRGVRPGSTHP